MMVEFIVIACLILLLLLGLIIGKKNQQEAQTFTDFFIGKRNFSTLIILSSLSVGLINGSSIVSMTSAVFSKGYIHLVPFIGIFVAHLWTALWVAKKMGPYLECLSPGDILENMYGREAKILMGFTGLFESIFTISVQIMVLSFICHYFFAIPHIFSAVGALFFTLIYSLKGGIKALIMSNILQFALFIIVLPIICCAILASLGSFDQLRIIFSNPPHNSLKIFDPYQNIAAFIYAALPAIFPLALQRMVMAKDVHQLKKSFLFTSFMQLIFIICTMFLGIYVYLTIPEAEPRAALLSVINPMIPLVKGLFIFGLLALLLSTINAYLNIAAVAITQDLFLSLFKRELNEVQKLKLAKLLLVGIGIFATILSIYWTSISFSAYFILCINNSVMLAIYMLGFAGFNPSKKGFLYSISSALAFLAIAFFIINMDEVYAGLLAIIITITGILASHYLNKTSFTKRYQYPLHKKKKLKWFDMSLKQREHCNVFAAIAIINSAYPFFLMIPPFNLLKMPFFFIFPLISTLSLLILFKEVWPSNLFKYFPVVWHMLIALSLPTLAFLMYLQSNYHSIWLIDIAVITLLLFITTKKNMALVTSISGALLAVFITSFIGINFSEYVISIGEICLIAHLISAIICLLFFKEQENNLYRSVSSKITHEAARSLSGMGMSAFFLEERISKLLYVYDLARRNNLLREELLSTEELVQLKELPFHLTGMKQRTSETLHSLLRKMDRELESEKKLETIDIISLTKEAILYPSFSVEQRKKIIIHTSHNFFLTAVSSEIVHVIINLIENALAAIKNKLEGQIEIWASDTSLFIKDNGSGIDRQILYKIFDEGFSTKGTSGQGLAFCKKIMQEHAGQIRCTSQKDNYTKFELQFDDINK